MMNYMKYDGKKHRTESEIKISMKTLNINHHLVFMAIVLENLR